MHMGHSQTPNSKLNDEYTFQTNSMHIFYISEVNFAIGIDLMTENPLKSCFENISSSAAATPAFALPATLLQQTTSTAPNEFNAYPKEHIASASPVVV